MVHWDSEKGAQPGGSAAVGKGRPVILSPTRPGGVKGQRTYLLLAKAE
jgi:hypothetical protein